jgi:hypothetical protein
MIYFRRSGEPSRTNLCGSLGFGKHCQSKTTWVPVPLGSRHLRKTAHSSGRSFLADHR